MARLKQFNPQTLDSRSQWPSDPSKHGSANDLTTVAMLVAVHVLFGLAGFAEILCLFKILVGAISRTCARCVPSIPSDNIFN